ncbi:MAG TPA: FkbM family methyltransferase [Blastocatellia bacterium]|nr:FkbM family methyltransferase [Blastocatellia bacterium]
MISQIDGVFWPRSDKTTWWVLQQEMATAIPALLDATPGRGVCVQAGGNAGLWPRALAAHFRAVYTFEPERELFECLVRNVPGNVYPFRAGLGQRTAGAGISYCEANPGGTALSGEGDLRVMTVDSLGLEECDLLCLDIEGFELHALMGAWATIDRLSPVISVEIRGLSERYGVTGAQTRQWLQDRGYSLLRACDWDELWRK